MPTPKPTIRLEVPADQEAIGAVHRLAFGGEDEARLVDSLRASGDVRLSLVAEVDGQVVGHLLLSGLVIQTPTGPVEGLALAPMAVAPDRQRRGIGSALVHEGLRIARERGHRIVIVLGHPEFYPRVGFSADRALPLRSEYSGPAFHALALVPGALDRVEGEVHYPTPFSSL